MKIISFKTFIIFGLFLLLINSSSSQSLKDTIFTNYFRRTTGWTAGDGTISIPLPDGRNLWLFGDSYIDHLLPKNEIPCLFQVRSAAMIQDGNHFTTLIDSSKTGSIRTLFKTSENILGDPVIWPGHGFTNEDTVYVFLHRYVSATLEFVDNYLAVFSLPNLEFLRIDPLLPANNSNNISYGESILLNSTNDSIYIYGLKKNWIVYDPYLARCAIKDIRTKWEFFDGQLWQSDATKSKKVSGPNVSSSFTIIQKNNNYYMITQELGFLTCGLGRNIYSYKANKATGPFSNRQTIYTVEDKIRDSFMITYNPFAHIQFATEKDLLISYNVNGTCPNECSSSQTRLADGYRPKFIRTPWNVIDPTITESHEIKEASEIDIYNRNGEWLCFQISSEEILDEFNLFVYSLEGKQLLSIEKLSSEPISILNWPSGIYIAVIKSKESVYTQKILKY